MKKLIFFVGCFFLMINSVWAISVSCPEVASPGEVIKVKIVDEEFNGIKAKYKFDNGFVYQNTTLNSGWKIYYAGVDGFSIGNVVSSDKLSMDVEIKVSMDLAVNQNYSLGLVEIEGNDSDYKSKDLTDVSCQVKLVSDINTLNSLTVDGVVLSPSFSKDVVSYKATTDMEKVVIRGVATDVNAKLEGDIGEKNLGYGANTFSIKVTSVRGNSKVYNLYITRNVKAVSDKVSKSSDATIKSLVINNEKIKLKDGEFLYDLEVANEVENIEVEAVANNKKASVNVEKPDKLEVGENNVKIIVTAEDGTKITYVVVVTRMRKLSSDASIRSLEIKNYDMYFDSGVYEYDLQIDGEDKLDISVVLNDENAKYKINGNKNLKDKSIIEIVVTAEDGSKKVYSINISKLGESNSNLISNYIKFIPLICFIGLIIVVLVVKIIKSNLSKNNSQID